MLRIGGLEVIAKLQRSDALNGVRVCVLTANEDPKVKTAVLEAKARLIAKPSQARQWRELISGLEQL